LKLLSSRKIKFKISGIGSLINDIEMRKKCMRQLRNLRSSLLQAFNNIVYSALYNVHAKTSNLEYATILT